MPFLFFYQSYKFTLFRLAAYNQTTAIPQEMTRVWNNLFPTGEQAKIAIDTIQFSIRSLAWWCAMFSSWHELLSIPSGQWNNNHDYSRAFPILLASQLLVGVGAAPLFTYGYSCIDEFDAHKRTGKNMGKGFGCALIWEREYWWWWGMYCSSLHGCIHSRSGSWLHWRRISTQTMGRHWENGL